MFEQLRNQLASTSYNSTNGKSRAAGLVNRCSDELSALGANVGAAESGSATSVIGAVAIARTQLATQTFPSNYAKWQALGKLDNLAAALTAAIGS